MLKRILLPLLCILLLFSGCAMMQSLVKSGFPYTTTLVIPASAAIGEEQTAISMAHSFDQDFSSDGNNANNVSEVRIVSAKLRSIDPGDFNIGSIVAVKVYMSKTDGSDEVMVAMRDDITYDEGNIVPLNIDNTHFLDALIRQHDIKIRMVYKLRSKVDVNTSLQLVMGISAYPAN